MSFDRKLWTAVAAALVVGLLLGGGGVFFILQLQMAPLRAQLAAEQIARSTIQLNAPTLNTESSAVASAAANASATVTAATVSSAASGSASPNVATLRQYAFVRSLSRSHGIYKIVVDYADFLTGSAAAAAATAHGDVSPPPHDYYIANDDKALATKSVKTSTKVKLFSKPDGTAVPAGYDEPLAAWSGQIAPSAPNSGIKLNGYWLTLTNNMVTAIEEVRAP